MGVDIFFVISGFLISSIIFDDLAANSFSFARFYARRIRRIFPALVLVLIVSLTVGAVLLLPDDFRRLGKHSAAGAAFVSNLALWQEANYFDVASDTKPLLHLWSLGIEEQFYLIWPALMWLVWRLRMNRFTLLATILLGSLTLCIKLTAINPVAAFYSPAARFWELATGSLLAFFLSTSTRPVVWLENSIARVLRIFNLALFERDVIGDEQFYRNTLSTFGCGLIVGSVFVITRRHEFPGWWALMPVIGTYLVIAAGTDAWLNRVIFSNKAVVFIGLISYPLYLWHWPLLAFVRIDYGSIEPPAALRAALVILAVGLAWLTYRYIERPIRFGSYRSRMVPALAVALATIAAFGLIDVIEEGFPGRIAQDKAAYADYFNVGSKRLQAEYNNYISQNRCNFYSWDATIPTLAPRGSIDSDCYTRHSSRSVMIIGDSNASDLYYGIHEVLPKDVSVLLIWSSGCQVSPVNESIIATHHCNMANYFEIQRIKADPPDVLLLSSNNSFDIAYIRQFAAMVKGYGVRQVMVLGQRPHWKPYLYKVILDNYWPSIPRYIPGHLDDELMSFTKTFKSQLQPGEPFEYIDEMQQFCNSEGCLTYLGDNPKDGLITADTVHLRAFASVWLAEKQLAPLILKYLAE